MRVLVTRPHPDALPLVSRLESAGHEVFHEPLMEIVARKDAEIPATDWQAVLVTSANGARSLKQHPAMRALSTVKAITVGPSSSDAARDAGFSVIEEADGDVNAVIAHVKANLDPASGALLYASGAKTAGNLEGELTQAGFTVIRVVLYDAVASTALSNEALDFLKETAAVLLFSPRTAKIWLQLVDFHDIDVEKIGCFCLSHNVARILQHSEQTCGEIKVCDNPTTEAMLELIDAAT